MNIGGTTSQTGRHAPSRKAEQVSIRHTHTIALDHTFLFNSSPKFVLKTNDNYILLYFSYSLPQLLVLYQSPSEFQLQCTARINKRYSDRVRRGKIDLDAGQVTDMNHYRCVQFVNVVMQCTIFFLFRLELVFNVLDHHTGVGSL